MSLLEAFYPESKFGGFTDLDGTIRFYLRVNALLEPGFTVVDFDSTGAPNWLIVTGTIHLTDNANVSHYIDETFDISMIQVGTGETGTLDLDHSFETLGVLTVSPNGGTHTIKVAAGTTFRVRVPVQ